MISESMSKENDDVVVVLQEKYTYKKLHLGIQKLFNDFLNLKYLNNQELIDKNEQKEFDEIVQQGIWKKKKEFSSESTLLHKGKKPRKDVWRKLGSIASILLSYSNYPTIHCLTIKNILNTALGDVVERTYNDYRETLLFYCNKNEDEIARKTDSGLGHIDVSGFVMQIPRQYITTSSTSSSRNLV